MLRQAVATGLLIVLGGSLRAAPAEAAGPGIAMVLTAKDARIVAPDATPKPARPMQVVEAGQVLETGDTGTARFTFLVDGTEHELTSSSSVRMDADRLVVLRGKTKALGGRKLSLPRSSGAVSRRLLGEMVRGTKGQEGRFTHPANMSAVPNGTLELRWELHPQPSSVTFVLEDDDGELVYRQELVGASHLTWPPDGKEALLPGQSYYAEVTARSAPDAIAVVEFRVLDAEEAVAAAANAVAAEELLSAEPADASPLMLLLLSYLENDLVAEARAVIERLEPLLPDSPELLAVKAHVLERSGDREAAQAARLRAKELDASS